MTNTGPTSNDGLQFSVYTHRTCTLTHCASTVQHKTRRTYDRILQELKAMVPLDTPELTLLDFENAAISAFCTAYPNAAVKSCYFHLVQSVVRKVNEIGMKGDYESDDDLRIAVRCLPALAMVPSSDVVDAFLVLADNMPNHDKMPELLSYFEHTYVRLRGRRRPGLTENYDSAIFPTDTWNHFETAGQGIAKTTNVVEGWHYGLQALFQCHHPTLFAFMKETEKEVQTQHVAFHQCIAGSQIAIPKRYRELNMRVQNAVDRYMSSEILVYLRAVVDLSHW